MKFSVFFLTFLLGFYMAALSSEIKFSSQAFVSLKTIPAMYTCKGDNVSPELQWSSPPKNTKSFAITCIDYDAPSGKFVHWIIFNIPASTLALEQGVDRDEWTQGMNHFRRIGYDGPCPPQGKPHKYVFTLYALDADLKLAKGVQIADFEMAIQSHILGQAQLTGLFGT